MYYYTEYCDTLKTLCFLDLKDIIKPDKSCAFDPDDDKLQYYSRRVCCCLNPMILGWMLV